MVKPDRLYALKALMEHRGCVPMSDILAQLEVSRATAKRDIEFLRDRMGVPVEWDSFDRGYRIRSDSRKTEGSPRELPGLWFTEQEIAALLTLHALVVGADEAGSLRRELQPLRTRLQQMLGATGSEVRRALARVRRAAELHGVVGTSLSAPWSR